MNQAGANYFTQDSFNPQGNTGELWFREGIYPSQSHPASKGRADSQPDLSDTRTPAKSSFLASVPHFCNRRALVLSPAVMSQHEYLLHLSMHHLSIYLSIYPLSPSHEAPLPAPLPQALSLGSRMRAHTQTHLHMDGTLPFPL